MLKEIEKPPINSYLVCKLFSIILFDITEKHLKRRIGEADGFF